MPYICKGFNLIVYVQKIPFTYFIVNLRFF